MKIINKHSAGQYGLLGFIKSANMNTTADQLITIIPGQGSLTYRIDRITVTNPSISLTLAAGGVYTTTSKGGTAIVAAAQLYSALTAAAISLDLTLAINTNRTESGLYLSLTTAQGAAATADLFVWGWVFDAS